MRASRSFLAGVAFSLAFLPLCDSRAAAQASVSGGSIGSRSGARSGGSRITAPLPDSGPTLPSRPVLPPLPGRGLESIARPPEELHYHWRSESNSPQLGLYLGEMKFGLYDPVTDIYRRVNVDGTLSEPVGKPWRIAATHPATMLAAGTGHPEAEAASAPSTTTAEHSALRRSPVSSQPAAPLDRTIWATGAIGSAMLGLLLFAFVLRARPRLVEDPFLKRGSK